MSFISSVGNIGGMRSFHVWLHSSWKCDISVLCMLVGALAPFGGAGRAFSQCTSHWLFGPDQVPQGLGGGMEAALPWDPDGPGPLSEVLVVVGGFGSAGDIVTRSIAIWNGEEWEPFGDDAADPNNAIRALAIYDDQLVVAGAFATQDGTITDRIARWDGQHWQHLGEGMTGRIDALISFDGYLYVGGDRWDGTQWESVSGLGNAREFAVHDGELFAAGVVFSADETWGYGVARWNGSHWEQVGESMNDAVWAVTFYDDELIAGGEFTRIGNAIVKRIARWDGTQWRELGRGQDHDVLALTNYDGKLIAAGRFGSTNASHVESWNGMGWGTLARADHNGSKARLESLVVFDGELIVGGFFNRLSGVIATGIARWSAGIGWQPLGSLTHGAPASTVEDFTVYDGNLVAAGHFVGAGNVSVNRVASWNGEHWEGFGPELNKVVHAVTVFDGGLIAGGEFLQFVNQPVERVARFDGTAWRTMGDGFDNTVFDLTTYNGELIAGGVFGRSGHINVLNIGRWDGVGWQGLGGGTNGVVYSVITYEDKLIAGGAFSSAGGVGGRNKIAQWNGEEWGRLGSGMNRTVRALTVYNDDLIAGGEFTSAGGRPVNHIARWDGTEWHALGGGTDNDVWALTVYNGELIVAGHFAFTGETPPPKLARWNGTNWLPFGHYPDSSVRALTVYNNEMIIGGSFRLVGDNVSSNWARWGPLSCDPMSDSTVCGDGLFCNSQEVCGSLSCCQAGIDPCRYLPCDESEDQCGMLRARPLRW